MHRENSSPSTPSIRPARSLPGPSPLSLKRSVSYGSIPSVDRPRKRRTRSSDIFQRRVSTLLEQAQSMYNDEDENTTPSSEMDIESGDNGSTFPSSEMDVKSDGDISQTRIDDIAFDGDLELLEAELTFDLSSDGMQKMELDENVVNKESNSDDTFEFDDIEPEELEALFSSHENILVVPAAPQTGAPFNEDDALFGDDDEYMDIDFDGTQPFVIPSHSTNKAAGKNHIKAFQRH